MRLLNVLMIIIAGLVTQSCKITMFSPTQLINISQTGNEGNPYSFDMSRAILARTGFKDTLIIGDDPESAHGELMKRIIVGNGIPEENIVFFKGFGYSHNIRGNRGLRSFTSGDHEVLRKATRVVHTPFYIPLVASPDALRIRENNILFVDSAGNMRDSFNGDRDMYNINHVVWNDRSVGSFYRPRANYNDVLEVYKTGKAIVATSGRPSGRTRVTPFDRVVQCGDIKESCFTVTPISRTSIVSARLSAISFYLAQFWETPEEIVEVLKSCAIDVGEPGVDREFGQGVVNLLCPPVLKKEVEVVSQYLEDSGEKGEVLQGGDLAGTWGAENTALEVYIPRSLKEVLQVAYQGTVTGAVEFKGNRMIADVTVEALIQTEFLLKKVIKATAEEVIQFEEGYTVDQENLVVGERSFHYTATEDSLFLVKSFSLNEILSLLPDPLGSMVDMASPDFFVDDPIQLRMSFSKEKPSLPGDFDGDGIVNTSDFLIFVAAFGASRGEAAFDGELDLVPDGIIGIADFLAFIDQFGKTSNS